MREVEKRNTLKNNQKKSSGRTQRGESKSNKDNSSRKVNVEENESKIQHATPTTSVFVSDSNTGRESSENYENMVIHYMDDVNRSSDAFKDLKVNEMVAKEKDAAPSDHSNDVEKEQRHGKEEVSDTETIRDSASSQGDSFTAEEDKLDAASRTSKSSTKRNYSEGNRRTRERSDGKMNKSNAKGTHQNLKKPIDSNRGLTKPTTKSTPLSNPKNVKVHGEPSSEASDGTDEKPIHEVKEIDALDGASNDTQSVGSDDETFVSEENGDHKDEAALEQRIEEMEMRIEKLEEELREVAALEMSLYSVAPDHGSSAHKVHTPARRLSRLYLHACKHWTQDKRATIAKNTVSGLVLIAKSCGNDVSRLTFWLSNTIVLREIISQAFGNSCQSSSLTRFVESNGCAKRIGGKSTSLKWKGTASIRQTNGFMQLYDDWQETGTFTSALEKVESWMFSRIVESVWWQALTPYMQSPVRSSSANKTIGRLQGPALGDQQQGNFSIDLWRNAFQDAFERLCPVRAEGHECGCLPVLARMVMEQCIDRLDVAMFNAILRESAHEIPTDPVSDPILDMKVLPIPAGDLSFGSGAQLKNSVGNWSRLLTDMFGIDTDDSLSEDQDSSENFVKHVGETGPKSFLLLNSLSDLLMLPKDMLLDREVRQEVCPSISLPLVKRILCNFTPDEFCPEPVPGAVLEALNAESVLEPRVSGDLARSFPYMSSPVIYSPPSSADVAEKIAEAGGKSQLSRNVSAVQKKGYTSDEELDELVSPLTAIIDKLSAYPTVAANGNARQGENAGKNNANARYELLREVWSM